VAVDEKHFLLGTYPSHAPFDPAILQHEGERPEMFSAKWLATPTMQMVTARS
jgi:hypothetical protein